MDLVRLLLLVCSMSISATAHSLTVRLDYEGQPFDEYFSAADGTLPQPGLTRVTGSFLLPFSNLVLPAGEQTVDSFTLSDGVNTYTDQTPGVDLTFWVQLEPPLIGQWSISLRVSGESVIDSERILTADFKTSISGNGRFTLDLSDMCVGLFPTGFCDQAGARNRNEAGVWSLTVVPVPGAVWLFGAALLAMLGLRRRA